MRPIQRQSEQYPREEPAPVHNDDVRIMDVPEEEGPGYRAIVRRSPDGKGWDVLKILGAHQSSEESVGLLQ